MVTTILHNSVSNISALVRALRYENIEVETCQWDSPRNIAEDLFKSNAVILHRSDTSKTPLNFIHRIRHAKTKVPIIFIDGGDPSLKEKEIATLDVDAYFSEPIEFRNLAIALKQLVCEKAMNNGDHWMRAYDLWLDLEQRSATRGEKPIQLRNKEFALLEFFVINRGKVLTRDSILEFVWDRNISLTSNTVDVHVNRLRRKIDRPFPEKLIHTIYNVGYKFEKIDQPNVR